MFLSTPSGLVRPMRSTRHAFKKSLKQFAASGGGSRRTHESFGAVARSSRTRTAFPKAAASKKYFCCFRVKRLLRKAGPKHASNLMCKQERAVRGYFHSLVSESLCVAKGRSYTTQSYATLPSLPASSATRAWRERKSVRASQMNRSSLPAPAATQPLVFRPRAVAVSCLRSGS